jgi:ABC-type multidrug transport system fused ATPase/permease subunit
MSGAPERAEIRRFLLASLRGRRPELLVLSGWALAEGLPAYLSGRLVARATDHGFLTHRPAIGLAWLGTLALAMVFGAWATRETIRRLAVIVEPFRDELVRRAVTTALHRSIVQGAAADTAGVARLAQHTEIAREAFAGVLLLVQGFAVMAVSTLIGLSTLMPAALLFVLPPFILGVALFAVTLRWAMAAQRASILADEGIAEAVSSLSRGLRDVVACGGESLAGAAVEAEIHRQAASQRLLARVQAVRSLAVSLGGLVPLVLILLGAPWLLHRGATIGVVLGVLTYVLQGLHPAIQQLVHGMGQTAAWLFVALERILEGSEQPSRRNGGQPPTVTPVRGHAVELRDVTFRYGPWAEPVLRSFSLDIPEGDHLAVIGPSGVGKSTLAGIVAGMLRPEAGTVLLGGAPVESLAIQTLAAHRVLIPQEAYVFVGSLRENLVTLRSDQVPDHELGAAVDALGLRSIVDRLGGFDAEVRPELLSAGERQLISVVRSYLSKAPLLILDEATCHLDPPAEALVEEAFARRPGSLVVIAHRLSSALRARRILLMDGTATLVGTHEELLAGSALYRDLVGYWAPEEPDGAGTGTIVLAQPEPVS